jgi:exo-beta-1,3-glucanase (GH17 family)
MLGLPLLLALAAATAQVAAAAGPTIGAAIPPAAVCARRDPATLRLRHLETAMAHGRFIAYSPTLVQIVDGKPTRADPEAIRADLQLLRSRFDSLITYGATNGAEAIPAIAASLHYDAVIIGLYDPFNVTEMNAALAASESQPTLVVGLSLGNELLFFRQHTVPEIRKLLDDLHARAPQLPLSTTEPFHVYYEPGARPLLERMDFLLPNVHPIFQPWFHSASDDDAAQFVVNVVAKLATTYCGPILVKETGVPTAPAEKGYTEQRQATFYQALQHRFPLSREHAFAYFTGFDAPWRLNDFGGPAPGQQPQPEEAHWGLYDASRRAKAIVGQIAPLGR